MMREYELTDDEFDAIIDALEYAEDNAVRPRTAAVFRNTRHEMAEQHIED